jgi:pyruvate kinase
MTEKILVTLGPSSLDQKTVERCAEFGVYVFRINLSHTPIENLEPTIRLIQSWTDVPVCLDTEGAQLRNGFMASEHIAFQMGDHVKINHSPIIGDMANISFNPSYVSDQLEIGDEILVDFNHVRFEVTKNNEDHFVAEVTSGGTVGSNKAADVNRDLNFEPLTEKDFQAIEIGRANGIEYFAMSFANRPEDVMLMREKCGPDVKIICKIESPSGVRNLEGILELTDEILIDRGDLSRRVPIELIPFLQRRIISIARSRQVPVYVATNLLESMVTTRSPNRAEVNDVVSTLEMGANGLILAAETAIGKHPVEAVKMVRALIEEHERWTPNTSIAEILQN